MRRFSIALVMCWLLCFQGVFVAFAQRVNRTQLNPGGEFDIVSYGANGTVCGATAALTDAAFTKAKAAAVSAGGGTIWFPDKTCTISAAQLFATAGITLRGYGSSSVIKAANSANLAHLLQTSNAATGFTLRDLVLDGNRSNGGMQEGSPANALILAGGASLLIDHVELRNSAAVGAFIGDNSVAPFNIIFRGNYIHDNGGVTNSGGFGTGIYFGGSAPVSSALIEGGMIARNYNTVTGPGPSNGISGSGPSNVTVRGVHFLNNLNNSGGGMINMFSSGGGCAASTSLNNIFDGNTITQTTTFGSDITGGIEVCGKHTAVLGNVIDGLSGEGIALDGGTPDGVVIGNVVTNTPTCLLLGNATGQQITGNRFKCATVAINFSDATASDITVAYNDLTGSGASFSGLPIAAAQAIIIGPNGGYQQLYTATVSGVTAAQSITATVHAQGALAIAKCFDGSTPRGVVACNWTRATNGDLLVGPFAPAFTGLIQVGPN